MNSLNSVVFSEDRNFFTVKTEDELLDKVDQCIKKVLKDQKVAMTFTSSSDPRFSETVMFGYREGNSFKGPDVNLNFIFDGESLKDVSQTSSEVAYDLKQHVSAVEKGSVSTKRMSYSNSKHGVSEKIALVDHPQLKEPCSLEFWKTIKKYPAHSKERLLSFQTSEKIQALVTEKLKQISPIVPPKEFGEDFGVFRYFLYA